MTDDHDNAGEDELAGLDLHAWRVPPPAPIARSSLVTRALTPAALPAQRSRLGWLAGALVLLNAVLAVLVVILVLRPAPATTLAVQPAGGGGGSVDAEVRKVLQRLELEQRALERKLREVEDLRALVVELGERVRQCEQKDPPRDRTVTRRDPVDRDRRDPFESRPRDPPFDPFERQPIKDSRQPTTDSPGPNPFDAPRPPAADSCDEVSCVLNNYAASCCAKLRAQRDAKPTSELPETLGRVEISTGIALVKSRIAACGNDSTARGKVKIHARVAADGRVTSATAQATPDEALGSCVAAAIKRAVFPRTQQGGSFVYPFVF
jgi:hypothetical protein